MSLAEVKIGQVYTRPWGRYTVLDIGEKYLVKRIEVDPGMRFSLQHHEKREEHWIVVAGELLITQDDKTTPAKSGDYFFIPVRQKHRAQCLSAGAGAFIEVQRGDYLGEDDIIRYEDDYGRAKI